VMMLAAAPAMANVNLGGGSGTFVGFSSQNFGGDNDSDFDSDIGFASFGDSSFDSVQFGG
jgi:hypothetical protein